MKCTMFLDPKVDRIVCEGELVELGKSEHPAGNFKR
jgi:hypothetical protein